MFQVSSRYDLGGLGHFRYALGLFPRYILGIIQATQVCFRVLGIIQVSFRAIQVFYELFNIEGFLGVFQVLIRSFRYFLGFVGYLGIFQVFFRVCRCIQVSFRAIQVFYELFNIEGFLGVFQVLIRSFRYSLGYVGVFLGFLQ